MLKCMVGELILCMYRIVKIIFHHTNQNQIMLEAT